MRIVFIVTSLLLLMAGAAIADGPATTASSSARKDRLADAQQQFDAALAELEAEPEDANFEQHKLLVEEYLSAAVYLVY